MALLNAAQSGMGGIVYGRSNGGGVAPGHAMENAFYVPPDPGNTFRDVNGRITYGAFPTRRGATKKSRPKIAGLSGPENPMLSFMKQMMGMPTGRVGNMMMNRNAKAAQNLKWKQLQLDSRNVGRQPPGGHGGLDRINPYIGPQTITQAPFWGIPTNQPPPNF